MTEAAFAVRFAGPLVSIQDSGRHGYMRFGVSASGPMDRVSFAAANAALGNPLGRPCIEVSMGGLVLECLSGPITIAVAGGGFAVECGDRKVGSWTVASVRPGERITIRPGHWGSWAYLAFAGRLTAPEWLGSASTHLLSGLGGGSLTTGQLVAIADFGLREDREGAIACPVTARPRSEIGVVLGPQDRFFSPETVMEFLKGPFRLSDAYDRMGVRLQGPPLVPCATLDMPSEATVRGSVQVAGDGVATVLLADHQTTGGYPKIATILDSELDGFVQHRPREVIAFRAITPEEAVKRARTRAVTAARYLESISSRPRGALHERLIEENLMDGAVAVAIGADEH